jgi:uncharacterized protein (DUF433 family)
MGRIDLPECLALERLPGKVGGAWLFEGTRLPWWVVLDNLSRGASLDEVADRGRRARYADIRRATR